MRDQELLDLAGQLERMEAVGRYRWTWREKATQAAVVALLVHAVRRVSRAAWRRRRAAELWDAA